MNSDEATCSVYSKGMTSSHYTSLTGTGASVSGVACITATRVASYCVRARSVLAAVVNTRAFVDICKHLDGSYHGTFDLPNISLRASIAIY